MTLQQPFGFRFAAAIRSAAFPILCAFLIIALLTGGASRPDALSQIVIRPVSVLAIALACFALDRATLQTIRTPLALLGLLAGLIAIQLVPLPPAIWTSLPGRELFALGAQVLDLEQPWRPISVAPARTWNSLVALLPMLAALLLFALLPSHRRASLAVVVIALLAASAILGLAQRAGPDGGPLYLYRVTNDDAAVGFFANRNHQAVAITCLFPLLATLVALSPEGRTRRRKAVFALMGATALVPLILATGSRAGVILGFVAILGSGLLIWRGSSRDRRQAGNDKMPWLALAVAGVLLSGMVWVTLATEQAEALYRIGGNVVEDDRFTRLDVSLDLARAAFPFGYGFGAFEYVFRMVEPADALRPSYFNQAHNDLVQIVIDGGIAATALLLAFIWWCLREAFHAWRANDAPAAQLARLGSLMMLLFLLASLVDYPLRTPFGMVLFALGAGWLASARDLAFTSVGRRGRD